MSAEAWRRIGSDLAPLRLAWHFFCWKLHGSTKFVVRAVALLSADLIEVKKGSSKMMMYSTSSAFKQQKLEETRDKPRERKKTASQRVSKATANGKPAAASCVAGVTLSAPQPRSAWQTWYFRCHPILILAYGNRDFTLDGGTAEGKGFACVPTPSAILCSSFSFS